MGNRPMYSTLEVLQVFYHSGRVFYHSGRFAHSFCSDVGQLPNTCMLEVLAILTFIILFGLFIYLFVKKCEIGMKCCLTQI
jgi:hypothetical protein